jgi:hypothetical protein
VVIKAPDIRAMKHDLSQFSKEKSRRKGGLIKSVNPSTLALRAYRKRYNIESYTIQLDAEVKHRWMKFCLVNGLSPSGLVQAFMQDTLSENEKKSS